MSISGRLHYLALGGLLIALAIIGASYAQDESKQGGHAPPTQQAQPSSKPPLPGVIAGGTEREKEVETNWNQPKCGDAKSHDEADLCEQRRMSAAAERSVRLNVWQVCVAVIGFAFVIWNLWYVRKATIAAMVAASAAEKITFEVEAPFLYPVLDWNSVGRVLATGLRHGATLKILEPEPIKIGFKVKNSGRSTAIVHAVDARIHFSEKPPELSDYKPDAFDTVEPTLEAESVSEHESVAKSATIPTAEEIVGIKEHRLMVFFLGKIEYSSVQGAGYVQTFCLAYNVGSGRFRPWPSDLNRRTRKAEEKARKKKRRP